jgi:hypothetical protein
MAETVETLETVPTEQVGRRPPVRRFRPFRGGLTMIALAVTGLIVLSPAAVSSPEPGRVLRPGR